MFRSNYTGKLRQPVNAFGIELFRKIFAVLLILHVFKFYSADVINKTFILTRTTIPYDFSAWMPVLPGKLIHIPFLLQIAGALLFFSTKYARLGAALFFVSFGYIFLLDISYYNNHFYFILLLCFLFMFYGPVKLNNNLYVSRLILYLFQFQVIVVYFFGGVVKLNADWLFYQQPMREMLSLTGSHRWPEWVVYIYTYGGILFDLSIGFLLLVRRTRAAAVVLTIVFHVLNHFMFSTKGNAEIGLFPFLMVATNLLFIDPARIQHVVFRIFSSPVSKSKKKSEGQSVADFHFPHQKSILIGASVYVLIQLILPIRHYFIPGNVDWTGEGYYFSWRMKIRSKKVANTIYVQSEKNAALQKVEPYTVLNTLQYKMVCEHPPAMHYFVQYLKKVGKEKMGMKDPRFYLNWKCAMNGHPMTPVVDSTVDFGALPHNKFGADKWILPYR